MKPILLVIKGLNSFNEEQQIDFEKLQSAGLFGIFGPTGSGKSTVIDALFLALYGKMPRHKQSTEIQSINNRTDSIYVSLTFELNREIYKAERTYTIKGKKFGSTLARLLKEKNGEYIVLADKLKMMNTEIKKIIGLEYDDFSRSVILPQGRFSEFLMLDGTEKRDMLERIFRLEEYGDKLNKLILDEKREYAAKVKVIDERLAEFGDVSEDILGSEEKRLILVKNDLLKLRNAYDVLGKRVSELRDKRNLYFEYRECMRQNDGLKQSEQSVLKKRERLQRALDAGAVAPYYVETAETTQRLEDIRKKIGEQERVAVGLENELVNLKKQWDAISLEKESEYPKLVEKAADLKRVEVLLRERDAIKLGYDALHKEYSECKKTKADLVKSKATMENERKAMGEDIQSIVAQKEKDFVSPATRKLIQAGAHLSQQKMQILNQINDMDLKKSSVIKTVEAETKKRKSADAKIEQLRKQIEQFQEKAKEILQKKPNEIESYAFLVAKTLVENQPCPVCGSVDHPVHAKKVEDTDIRLLHEKMERWEAEQAACSEEMKKAEGQVYDLLVKRAALLERIIKDERTVTEYEKSTNEYREQIVQWEETLAKYAQEAGLPLDVDFEKEMELVNDKDSNRVAMDGQEKKLREAVARLEIKLNEVITTISQLDSKMEGIIVSGKERKVVLDKALAEIQVLSDDREPKQYSLEIHEKIKSIDFRLDQAKKSFDQATEKLQKITSVQSGMAGEAKTLEETLTSQQKKLADSMNRYRFLTMETVMAAGLHENQILELDHEIKQYDDQCKTVKDHLLRISEKLVGVDLEHIEEQATKQETEYRIMGENISQKTAEAAVLEERFAQLQNNLEQVKSLRTKRKADHTRLILLEDLSGLFMGNRFVEYIAKRQLRYISFEATKRLKAMTGGRYALEMDGTDFIIRDDFHLGIRRSQRTLSGGEVFMVSLCLALALSSKIQMSGATPLSFFFLDEGFGTLDSACLDTVMTTLEELQREEKSIGIISHVEELKDRVPAKLLVIPQTITHGSMVKIEV